MSKTTKEKTHRELDRYRLKPLCKCGHHKTYHYIGENKVCCKCKCENYEPEEDE